MPSAWYPVRHGMPHTATRTVEASNTFGRELSCHFIEVGRCAPQPYIGVPGALRRHELRSLRTSVRTCVRPSRLRVLTGGGLGRQPGSRVVCHCCTEASCRSRRHGPARVAPADWRRLWSVDRLDPLPLCSGPIPATASAGAPHFVWSSSAVAGVDRGSWCRSWGSS